MTLTGRGAMSSESVQLLRAAADVMNEHVVVEASSPDYLSMLDNVGASYLHKKKFLGDWVE